MVFVWEDRQPVNVWMDCQRRVCVRGSRTFSPFVNVEIVRKDRQRRACVNGLRRFEFWRCSEIFWGNKTAESCRNTKELNWAGFTDRTLLNAPKSPGDGAHRNHFEATGHQHVHPYWSECTCLTEMHWLAVQERLQQWAGWASTHCKWNFVSEFFFFEFQSTLSPAVSVLFEWSLQEGQARAVDWNGGATDLRHETHTQWSALTETETAEQHWDVRH